MECQLEPSPGYQYRLFIIVTHNIVSMTFVRGLWATDKRSFYQCCTGPVIYIPLQYGPRVLIPPSQQPDTPLLQRALTKLKEVRDFHMEKAINSSMPKGGRREEGREPERMSGDVISRERYEGGWGNTQYYSFWFKALKGNHGHVKGWTPSEPTHRGGQKIVITTSVDVGHKSTKGIFL